MVDHKVMGLIRKSCSLICHQKPERCFVINGFLFPVCARCTGIIGSFIVAMAFLMNDIFVEMWISVIMVLVMFLDWILQAVKIKESTNRRRFITGLIGGFGMSYMYYYIVKFLMELF